LTQLLRLLTPGFEEGRPIHRRTTHCPPMRT
jgi:hypothetical protein